MLVLRHVPCMHGFQVFGFVDYRIFNKSHQNFNVSKVEYRHKTLSTSLLVKFLTHLPTNNCRENYAIWN